MLPDFLNEKYEILKDDIKTRLIEFENVSKDEYFYELCFCICTPQSRAESAFKVQQKLKSLNFYENDIDPTPILFDKTHYIRFHNQKAKRLIKIKEQYPEILEILKSEISDIEKRFWLRNNINGMGLKESAHYLRNIGYKNLCILDRHILKHLVHCGIYNEIPNISSDKKYLEVEDKFRDFADNIGIPLDELDLLFWSYETGEILK